MKAYYEQSGVTIYHGDCRDVIEQWEGLRTHSFDLLLTDPPYGIDYGRAGGFSAAHGWGPWRGNVDWDVEQPTPETITRCRNVCKQAVIWGGNYFVLPPRMGWLVWDKGQRTFSLADGELAWTSEQRAMRIFTYSRAMALTDGKVHPTQKPEALMVWTLSMFAGARSVLDPFMGVGTTLVAAKRHGRTCTGIEVSEKYCEIAANRLRQDALPLEVGQ